MAKSGPNRLTGVRFAAWTIAVSLVPFLYTQVRYYSHKWMPLDVPVPLNIGSFMSPSFQTDFTGSYEVWIDFNEVLNDRQSCELGDRLALDCSTAPQTLHLIWRVVSSKRKDGPFTPYEARGFSSSYHRMSAYIGGFTADQGSTQRIEVKATSDAGDLKEFSPHLRVEAAIIYWEKWIIYSQAALFLFGITCFICLAYIAIALSTRYLDRRGRSNAGSE